jgi:ribonuclease III
VDTLQQLQLSLDVYFNNLELLQQAFVHRSYLNEAALLPHLASNERLEFLGDAVLGLVVGEELYRRFPDRTEGSLTEMRAQLVRGSTLGQVGERLGLGSLLVLGRGEDQSGGRGRIVNLGRALEALLGAVYLDQGLDVTRGLVLRLFEVELTNLTRVTLRADAKSLLQQLAQATYKTTPEYVTVAQAGPDHSREFIIEVRLGGRTAGTGRGKNKRLAQQAAAAAALELLAAVPDLPATANEAAGPLGDADILRRSGEVE